MNPYPISLSDTNNLLNYIHPITLKTKTQYNPIIFLFRENTVAVQAFVRTPADCQTSCSENEECGYFKYFSDRDERQPMMCYHLRGCAVRVIVNRECPIEPNNYIDHTLFTKNDEECKSK